jgi:uncharacterized protein YuzE
LFTIDNIERYNIDKIEPFLLGLADGIARRKNIDRANLYAKQKCKNQCPGAVEEISEKSQKILSPATCQLNIELSEVNGNIEFTVNKYHRIKFDTIKCMTTEDVNTCDTEFEDNDITDTNCKWKTREVNSGLTPFYPILEFDSSNPYGGLSGIDYIDYLIESGSIKNILKNGVKTNVYKFTVKGKTIEDLIKGLTDTKSIMVNENGDITTIEIENERKAVALAEENKRKEETARAIQLKEQAENAERQRRANMTQEERDAEDKAAADRRKKEEEDRDYNAYQLTR